MQIPCEWKDYIHLLGSALDFRSIATGGRVANNITSFQHEFSARVFDHDVE